MSLDKYPQWLAFYDRKKNRGLKIEDICSGQEIWWRCPVASDHSWLWSFQPRIKLRCPFCSGRMLAKSSSLAVRYPKIAKELHPTRNGEITADQIRAHCNERYWWRCLYNPKHVWNAIVDNRTRRDSGCPDCWKARRSGFFKKLAAQRALSSSKDSQ